MPDPNPALLATVSLKTLVRLEPITTITDLTPGLEARIADPLWLLGRQWQFGELHAEDASTPVRVELELEFLPLTGLSSAGAEQALAAPGAPLEASVEAENELAPDAPGYLRTALELGFLARRALVDAQPTTADFLWTQLRAMADLTVSVPADHPALRMMARGGIDGAKLATAYDAGELSASLSAALTGWRTLARRDMPPRLPAGTWTAEGQDHDFQLRAGGTTGLSLVADHYVGGRLDWFSVDLSPTVTSPTQVYTRLSDAIPSRLRFRGSPTSRWWEIEDEAVALADLEAGEEDVVAMLVAELVTAFGEDWYLLPVQLDHGSVARVRSVRVHDVFTYGTSKPVVSFAQQDGGKRTWRLFELDGQPTPSSGSGCWLFVAPTVADSQEGESVEEVKFIRDEVSNLGWAVERIVEGPDGEPRRRAEPRAAPAEPRGDEGWAWRLASPVPLGWVPLVPIPIGTGPEMALQRGRLPPPFEGAKATVLVPGQKKLVLQEALIPPAGVVVTRRWQRARAPNGDVLVWLGHERLPGSGEPGAELVFDQLLR